MSFPAYDSYRDSGIEYLGAVPSHWPIAKLKHLGSFNAGAGFPHDAQGVEGEILPFHKVNALGEADALGYLTESENTVSYETAARLRAHVFPPESVVFAKIGAALLLGRIRRLRTHACLDNNVMGFTHEPPHQPQFLRYLFNLVRFDLIANPGTVPSLNEGQVANVQVAVPPVREQRAIAAFLDRETAKIDALVEAQRRMIELLTERLSSLAMSDAVGDWVRLDTVVDEVVRPVEIVHDEIYTRIGLYNRGRGLFHKDPVLGAEIGESSFFRIESGDLILSGQFAWEGAVALAGDDETGKVVSHRYPVLRGREGVMRTEAVFAILASDLGNHFLRENSRGAAGRNRPLHLRSLLKEKVPLLRQKTQEAIVEAVNARTAATREPVRLQNLLMEHRAALISAAVTGKIDVRGIVSPEVQAA